MQFPQPLAIVGAACRLPGAANIPAFASLLLAGRSAIQDAPPDRWTKSRYFHPTPGQPGKTYTYAAGTLPEIFDFDPAFFGISPREALSIDPQQRLMLELAHEATEDAGLLPSRLTGTATGVFVGASSWDFAAVSFADAAALDAYGMQGAALSSIANRISYVFGLRGPSLTVDTACSSSLVALHLASQAIQRGEIGQAIVGGVNLLIAPQSFIGFARASMLSRLGRCHSFDARADGYVRGEGGGAVILKTLASAIADGNEIRAVLRATGMNSDGKTNGFAVPSGLAQAELIRQVCARAEVTPDEFAYFEAHGTGTPVGDPIEAHAIGEAVGQVRHAPLPIGSVKSNIGHLEAASGMAGLMKLLVCLGHNVIPASLNFETPNPNIPFAALNLRVVTQQQRLGPPTGLFGINSFGFGGTNAHAILAAPPPLVPRVDTPCDLPLLLSARCAAALTALAAAWRDTLTAAPAAEIPALLRGAARLRDHHPHRMVVSAPSPTTLDLPAAGHGHRLAAWLSTGAADGVTTGQSDGGIAFVYSGNGSQWAGMGLEALRTNETFRGALTDVDARMAPELGWSVTDRLLSDDLAATIRHTTVAQPLLFAIQVAIVATLRAMGVRPVAHIGHSAGEAAAAWGSGALTLDQACHVIIQRSLLQGGTHGQGGMTSLAMTEPAAEALIAKLKISAHVAAINTAASVTVAGPTKALDRLENAAHKQRAWFSRLDLDYAFHSPAMDTIRAGLLAALGGLHSATPVEPLISSVTGGTFTGQLDAGYWWRNVRQPVRFADAIAALLEQDIRNFLEIGPQPVLQSYLRDLLRDGGKTGRVLPTLSRRAAAGDALGTAAAEAHVLGADLSTAPGFDGSATARRLPLYPFQRQRHATARTVESIEVIAPVDDHPLLGFRDPASRDAWMSHLSTASQPWLADHVVDGAVVLPAAAIIEIALAAARVRHPDAELLEIQDMEISQALVLEPNMISDCRTTVSADGHWQLASRPRLSPDPTQSHATCRIIPGLGARPVLPTIEPDQAQELDASTVYARARTLRLDYGPAFQTVIRVHRTSATQGLAELAPGDPGRLSDGYLLDPAVLDGSLQALLALVAGDPRVASMGAVMPWRFGRVRLLRQGAAPDRASLHVRHIGPRSICADIALCDTDGTTIVELLDCWFVAMPTPRQAMGEKTFWTAYVPSLFQPAAAMPHPTQRVIAAIDGVEAMPDGVLLADACVAAIAHEALLSVTGDTHLPPSAATRPLIAAILPWLEEDGLATQEPSGWRLLRTSDLPAAVEIWRSLMFGTAEGAAECVMLATLGPALVSGDPAGMQLSPVLRDQALFASASAREAMAAMLRGLDAITATWPAGSCLRVAVTGALNPGLLHHVTGRIEARGIPLRLVALATEPGALSVIQDVMTQTPGASALLWPSMPDEAWHGFDLVLDLYGLSLPPAERLHPEQLLRLLAPFGTLLAAEPAASRAAVLLFGAAVEPGPPAILHRPETWCRMLRDSGFASAEHTLLDGAIWPACLLVATAPGDRMPTGAWREQRPIEPWREQDGLIVFAAPNDRLAAALAANQKMLHLLPIEAMREVLTAPFAARHQHVLLLASDPPEDGHCAETLAELLADISTGLHRMPPAPPPKLWLVSWGSPADSLLAAALTGLRRVAANELPELDCRTISLDAALPDAEAAICILRELAEPDQEPETLWRIGGRLVPRLRAGLPEPPLVTGPRRLEVARPGLIGSLVWLPADVVPPGPNEVAIDVHASALNFRDVMWAQGLLPDEALLAGFSGPHLGLECAGTVAAVGEGVDDLRPGDRVAAVAPAAMATRVVTSRNGVMRMPPSIPFAAAATMPVAFMTAAYALGHLARLRAGETVLIHSGAGGVGLAAIQYALHKGAVVYATAGSDARRQTLTMLGATAVFDSRGTSFVDDILAETGGKGVDVVLNSVSLELMKQSVRLLRPFGRFLEIGKRDLYRDTPIGVRSLRHNASYSAIDVDELMALRPDVGLSVLKEVSDLLEAGELRPLPYRAFGFRDAIAAFRLLQSSGHVGKVVLLPEPTRPATKPPPFALRADGVYLVTGGLSGFGLEAARWVARQGGGRLALISRRGPATPDTERALAEFARIGVDARAFACDVAEPALLLATLEEIRSTMGPVHGVMHAAMVLDDALLHDLDAARFATVLRAKLAGALALDRLTRDDPIELFVLFSSVTTVIGTPGQASYVAANRTLEAVAERRHAAGLPALAVQWGPIGDAGYLVRESRVSDMLAAMLGSPHLRATQALEALPLLLATGRPVLGLADVAWAELRGRLPGLAGPFWSEMPVRDQRPSAGQSLGARLAEMTPAEALAAVQEVLVDEIARILQQPAGTIGTARPINEFGVDSLMAVELQTAVEARLGQQVPLTALTGAATLNAIAARLLKMMERPDTAPDDAADDDDADIAATISRHEAEPVIGTSIK